jgi:MFS family permease
MTMRAFSTHRLCVATLFFVNGFVFASWVPHIPAVKQSLDLSEAGLGALLLAIAAGAIVALPCAGWLVARFGSRLITTLAALGFCAALPLPLLAGTVAGAAAALALFGACNATLDVAMNAQAVEVERLYRRPILSSFHALFSVGGLAGAATAGGAMSLAVSDPQHIFAVSAAGLIVVAFVLRGLLPVAPAPRDGPLIARPTGALVALGLLTFLALMTEGAVADWSAVYLREGLATDPATAAAGFAAFSGTMAIGRLSGDWLAARIAPRRLLMVSGATAFAGLAACASTSDPAIAIAGFGVAGLGIANAIPLTFSAAGRVSGVAPGVALVAVASTGYCGYLAGPALIGLVSEAAGLPAGIGLVAAACALLTVGSRWIANPSESGENAALRDRSFSAS